MDEINLDEVLTKAAEIGASDVHFTVGVPVHFRIKGEWRPYPTKKILPPDTEKITRQLLDEEEFNIMLEHKECDISYSVKGVGRYRVNIFFQRGSFGIAMRVLPFKVPDFTQLNLPGPIMSNFAIAPNGIILICGATGSGKSTTLAAIVSHINTNYHKHIVTIEDPIEYLHYHNCSIVDQREIGTDTNSFADAMRHVLRQTPDVVLIGEIRDLETLSTALMLAETGHLVLSTIHAGEVIQGLTRLCDMFPADQQKEVRLTLSLVLRGMVVQQLLPTADNTGQRVLATEVLVGCSALKNLIKEGKFDQVYSQLQTRQDIGMHTMNASLLNLWKEGLVKEEIVINKSPNPKELQMLIDRNRYNSF